MRTPCKPEAEAPMIAGQNARTNGSMAATVSVKAVSTEVPASLPVSSFQAGLASIASRAKVLASMGPKAEPPLARQTKAESAEAPLVRRSSRESKSRIIMVGAPEERHTLDAVTISRLCGPQFLLFHVVSIVPQHGIELIRPKN